MAEHAHDEHHAQQQSPVAASIVGLLIALFFGWVFAQLNGGSWQTGVTVAVAILAAHTLVFLWVTDKD